MRSTCVTMAHSGTKQYTIHCAPRQPNSVRRDQAKLTYLVMSLPTNPPQQIPHVPADHCREGIICRHASCELKQFTHEQIDEQVCIPWLFWTRYDPNTKNVVLLEVLLWRNIVVENEEDPCSKLPPFKGVNPSVVKPSAISQ